MDCVTEHLCLANGSTIAFERVAGRKKAKNDGKWNNGILERWKNGLMGRTRGGFGGFAVWREVSKVWKRHPCR